MCVIKFLRLALTLAVSTISIGIFTSTVSQAAPEAGSLASASAQNSATTEAPANPKPKPDANGYYVGGPAYVSERNKIWGRSGPSDGYRVTSQHQVCELVTFKRYSDNGRYVQLESADGDTFWMPFDAVQPDLCGAALVDKISSDLAALQEKYDNYDNDLTRDLKEAKALVEKLSKENEELKTTLTSKEATITELDELYRDASSRLETRDLDMQMRWWMQGAIIAFCGAVAGVIFVFIPRPSRKQRRDRY